MERTRPAGHLAEPLEEEVAALVHEYDAVLVERTEERWAAWPTT